MTQQRLGSLSLAGLRDVRLPVTITCRCDYHTRLSTGESWDGQPIWVGERTLAVGLCPACEDIRLVEFETEDAEEITVAFTEAVEDLHVVFAEDNTEEGETSDSADTDPLTTTGTDQMTTEDLLTHATRAGVCPDCGHDIRYADRTTGPDHPEIGWEYYECPDCGGIHHPDSIA